METERTIVSSFNVLKNFSYDEIKGEHTLMIDLTSDSTSAPEKSSGRKTGEKVLEGFIRKASMSLGPAGAAIGSIAAPTLSSLTFDVGEKLANKSLLKLRLPGL